MASFASPALVLCTVALLAGCNNPPAAASPPTAGTPTQRQPGKVTQLDPPTFQRLAAEKAGILLDVRTPGEVARGRLTDATVIDINDARFAQKIDLMQRDKPIFVYCASGGRSGAAAEMMAEKGFAEVYNLEGGLGAWARAGLPVDRSAAQAVAPSENAMTPDALDAVLKGEKRVLVDYHTPWCTPCRKMAPVMAAVTESWKGKARVVLVDVEQREALAQREKIQGVPVFVLYVDGKERWRKSGEMPREVLEAELARP